MRWDSLVCVLLNIVLELQGDSYCSLYFIGGIDTRNKVNLVFRHSHGRRPKHRFGIIIGTNKSTILVRVILCKLNIGKLCLYCKSIHDPRAIYVSADARVDILPLLLQHFLPALGVDPKGAIKHSEVVRMSLD